MQQNYKYNKVIEIPFINRGVRVKLLGGDVGHVEDHNFRGSVHVYKSELVKSMVKLL
jgi:hypothetical protein